MNVGLIEFKDDVIFSETKHQFNSNQQLTILISYISMIKNNVDLNCCKLYLDFYKVKDLI